MVPSHRLLKTTIQLGCQLLRLQAEGEWFGFVMDVIVTLPYFNWQVYKAT